MKKFNVELTKTLYSTVEVEADTEEEAIDIAFDMCEYDDIEWEDDGVEARSSLIEEDQLEESS